MDKNQRIMNQKSSNKGKFTFTVIDGGKHEICFTVHANSNDFPSTSKVKVTLDLAVKEDREVEKTSEKIDSLYKSLIDLNNQISRIRKEQIYQRERGTKFNDTNEAINYRIFIWIIVQICLIVAVCFWQLRHLRRFFEAKKLV
ncbi:hypothetical protein BB561_002430 [Smittium simulii]|uniref:GOLD domain-containing protein n=1 Tax=Smittium simulii TaxID=133385 RepID=A0A2T9YQH4_9FUNG|nr:hypothetical protein BB561_002430 [Smittium simulii]